MSPTPQAILTIDFAIILIWGGIFAFFVRRWARYRKLISLGIAVMALGWAAVGLGDVASLHSVHVALRIVAVLCGMFIWYAIVRVEKRGR